jgi:hypothetical protein
VNSIIKISPASKACRYLKLPPEAAAELQLPHSCLFVDIPLGEVVGKLDEKGCIPPNSTVVLHPKWPLQVLKFAAMLDCNPELFQYGIAQFPRLLTEKDHAPAAVVFTARKSLDPTKLTYLFRVVLVD